MLAAEGVGIWQAPLALAAAPSIPGRERARLLLLVSACGTTPQGLTCGRDFLCPVV